MSSRSITAATAVGLALLAVAPPSARAELVKDERIKMTSPMSIAVDAPAGREAEARAAMDDAYAEVDRLVDLVSEWIPTSDVSRVNAAAGTGIPTAVAPETYALIAKSVEIGALT